MNLLIKRVLSLDHQEVQYFQKKQPKVIGIHKASSNYKKENYGDFIFPIINILNNFNEFNKNVEKKTNKQNELKVIIKLSSVKDYYLSFIVFGKEFVKNNNDKCKIIINGREDFELNQLSFQYKDEKFNNFIVNNNIEILEIILKETKTITNMDNMFQFYSCDTISIDFKNWDTSNITSMKNMFSYCRNFKNIKGISAFNTFLLILSLPKKDASHLF